jgi:hypothetical protein
MAVAKPKRRKPGRPRKYGEGRINATVRFTPERYKDLKEAADYNRRSVSEEVEARIEKAFTYDTMLDAMHTTVAQIKDGNIEAAFRAAGYTPEHLPDGGKRWVPKDYHAKQSGFIPPADEED